MACVKCRNKSTIKLPYLEACNSCFIKIIEKRIRKEVRVNRLLLNKDDIIVINDRSASGRLNSLFLPKQFTKSVIDEQEYNIGKIIKTNAGKIVIPWNLDDENEYFLGKWMAKEKFPCAGHFELNGKLYVKPLINVTEEECVIYLELHGIKVEKRAGFIIDEIAEKYPESRFNLRKNIDRLGKSVL